MSSGFPPSSPGRHSLTLLPTNKKHHTNTRRSHVSKDGKKELLFEVVANAMVPSGYALHGMFYIEGEKLGVVFKDVMMPITNLEEGETIEISYKKIK